MIMNSFKHDSKDCPYILTVDDIELLQTIIQAK
jgi:hypothetical protein